MKEQKIPYGSVIGFESYEELEAYMQKEEQAAIERTMPAQWLIGWGSYVIRVVEELVIWGHIYSETEFLDLERSTEGGMAPEAEEEIQAELESLKEAFNFGYRYGKWYSVVEPTGEYGSAHVSSLWEITKADFLAGSANGWELTPELGKRLQTEILGSVSSPKEEEDGHG